MLVNPGLARLASQVQYERCAAQIGLAGAASERMFIRQFESEAYPRIARGDAWRDLLAQLRLRSAPFKGGPEVFAAASVRGDPHGLALGRLRAGLQTLSPLTRRSRLPICLLPLEDDIEVEGVSGPVWVPPGTLVLLPADQEWRIALDRIVPIVVVSLSDGVLDGRSPGWRPLAAPRRLQPEGFSGVFIKLIETAAAEMDSLSAAEWRALEQGVADLFLTIVGGQDGASAAATPSLVALFNRVTAAIERRLHDPDLTAPRIARGEGISERYLQKLFEQTGVSFGHYLRERRLQRARAALIAPGDIHPSVADVGYRCGFGDAANFNRLFKERFGIPPGAFRSQQADRLSESGGAAQRGWPLSALANRKLKQRSAIGETASRLPAPGSGRDESARHRLAVRSANVHWGYFSRSLRPVLEIRSGDSVEIETLTQHASDDPDLMIRGDAAAEEVFFWTKDRKAVDRRGAGPIDASIFGRGAGEGFGVHICTGPIHVKDAEPGDVIEVRIDDMAPRPSRSPGYEGRSFGSNVAAWWGYHYGEFIQEPKPRENVTIYEIFADGDEPYAKALYAYRWSPQVDPFGVVHRTYDYPGVPVDKAKIEIAAAPQSRIRIPLRPHFGVIALAPREADPVEFGSAGLFRRQSRQLAPRQRRGRLPAGLGPRRPPVDRRSACGPGRRRDRGDRDRMLDDRARDRRPAQEGQPLRRPHLPADRDADRMGSHRLQPSELPRRIRLPGTGRSLRHLVPRSCDEGRLPQGAPISHGDAELERGRGDRGDFRRRRFRRDAGRGRQLGRPRHRAKIAARSVERGASMQFHMITGGPRPVAPFSHAVETDGFVFVTGQMPDTPEAPGVLPEGVEAQTRNVFSNLATVLAGLGLTLEHVVMARVYLTAFKRDYEAMNRVYRSFFAEGRLPARTCVGVTGLAYDALIEIDLVARRPDSRS